MTGPLVGLELHIQISTASKAFCSCPATHTAPPNKNVCPVCMGYPGALPVMNSAVVSSALKLGLALACTVNDISRFDRKNYFYPDLPKGYQITQFYHPICSKGSLELQRDDLSLLTIGIDRIHIEEDSAKSVHAGEGESFMDYNRSGIPLLELVTAPDFHTGKDAALFVKRIQQLVRYLDLCDGKLEDGSLRCDVNVSVPGNSSRSEVKNLNSLQSIHKAIEYEIQRLQRSSTDSRNRLNETQTWDEARAETVLMRYKESSVEYGYQAEPDLLPLVVSPEMIQEAKASLPELPNDKKRRFQESIGLDSSLIDILTETRQMADCFEEALSLLTVQTGDNTERLAHLISGEFRHILREQNIEIDQVPGVAAKLADTVNFWSDGSISSTAAKKTLQLAIEHAMPVEEIIREHDLRQLSDKDELESMVKSITDQHPDAVIDIRAGKTKALGFLMGEIMNKSGGKANPVLARELLEQFIQRKKQ